MRRHRNDCPFGQTFRTGRSPERRHGIECPSGQSLRTGEINPEEANPVTFLFRKAIQRPATIPVWKRQVHGRGRRQTLICIHSRSDRFIPLLKLGKSGVSKRRIRGRVVLYNLRLLTKSSMLWTHIVRYSISRFAYESCCRKAAVTKR